MDLLHYVVMQYPTLLFTVLLAASTTFCSIFVNFCYLFLIAFVWGGDFSDNILLDQQHWQSLVSWLCMHDNHINYTFHDHAAGIVLVFVA